MKALKTAALAVALLLLAHAPSFAQATATTTPAGDAVVAAPSLNFHAVGIGLVVIGAAVGIGGLTKSSVESIARQPEVTDSVRGVLILAAALIEGVAFFALIIIGFILRQ